MKIKNLIKIINPYCRSITHNGKHYKATLPTGKVITISSTSSDSSFHKMVFQDFRRQGIIINDLNKNN
ncbi:MAG: hypothetical protein WCX46_02430 [Candidatus Paceibacterota bacterium]